MRARTIVGLLLSILLASAVACSILPWGKRSPYTKEELARLADKDIYIIDGEKYIKVPAEKDEKGNTKFKYMKVERYLAGEVEPLPLEAERVKRTEVKKTARVKEKEVRETEPKKVPLLATKPLKHPYLKRKIAILTFEDYTQFTYEKFGEIIAEGLAEKMEAKLFTSLVMDREVIRLTMKKLGLAPKDLENPSKAKLLNKNLGIQVIIKGGVYGPFVTSSAPAQSERSSIAIVRVEVKLIDAAQGRIVKEFAVTNPLGESEDIGVLSEERAKYNAAYLAIDQILSQVAEEINGMGWFTRIALVKGNKIYLNAGYQTGLKEGDLLEVYPAGDLGGTSPKGRIKVSKLFGVDASVAQIIKGSRFRVNDVVKPLPQS